MSSLQGTFTGATLLTMRHQSRTHPDAHRSTRAFVRMLALPLTIAFVAIIALTGSEAYGAEPKQSAGALVLVGGGGIPEDVLARAMELAGGPDALIVVLPQASPAKKHSERTVREFKEAGAHNVRAWRFEGSPGTERTEGPWPSLAMTADAINLADLIWFSGGLQGRLVEALDAAGLSTLIRDRHRAGTVVGGSSAGAAVMSAVMITGEKQSLKSVTAGSTHVAKGLDLWRGVIVDQHFLERRRNNRLLAAVLDRPDHVGIGIDERTALIVTGERFEVLGESSVIVFDARDARVKPATKGSPAAAMEIRTHVLVRGMSYDLAE